MAQLEQVRELVALDAGLQVQLWYESAPSLTDPALLSALDLVADVTEPEADSILTDHPGLAFEAPAGVVALVTAIARGADDEPRPDTAHTFDWPQADDVLLRCRHSVIVTELAASPYGPAERAEAFFGVLSVMVRHTKPLLLGWPAAAWVSNPAVFDPANREGLFNVRMFGMDRTGELVMDTLGLEVFDLPDVQCQFFGVDPNKVAGLLFQVGSYLLAQGDVIADGDTVSPPGSNAHFVVHRDEALIGPLRDVLDIKLGGGAVGDRKRG